MKKKVSPNGDFEIRDDEDIDLDFGMISYDSIQFSPVTGERLEEVDVPSEDE